MNVGKWLMRNGGKTRMTMMAGILLAALTVNGESYARLDEKIVDAYNADPKKSQDVYIYAMQILEKTRQDSSSASKQWEDKAKMLITVACYCEADRAIDNHELQNAYLWSMRGMASGAARGELQGINMKQLYDYLKNLTDSLERVPEVKDMKYGKTMHEILDYRTVKKSSHYQSRDQQDPAGRPIEKTRGYQVQEGPTQDSGGNIFVKVRYETGTPVIIRYVYGKGWRAVPPPDPTMSGYYASWQECAAAGVKFARIDAPPVVRNRVLEKNAYYQPAVVPAANKEVNSGEKK